MILKYDFILVYESLSREIESVTLIYYLLVKKGYKVKIINERSLFRHFIRTSVLVVPYLYSTEDVKFFNRSIFLNVKKIVNLQWEQVVSESDLITNFHNPKGDAINGFHICWGNNTYQRLTKSGVSVNHLRITGNISMDFNSAKFSHVHLGVDEIRQRYFLTNFSKIVLFLSSFVFENMSEQQLTSLKNKIVSIDTMKVLSELSKKSILEWFARYLENNENEVLIYRPHPSESISDSILELKSKFSNFRIIKDFSVRQWIKVSDIVITWYSTSIVDSYFAHKGCLVLRPYEIPETNDISFFKDEPKIVDERSFIHRMKNNDNFNKHVNNLIIEHYGSNEISGEIHKSVIDYLINVSQVDYNHVYQQYNLRGRIKLFLLDLLSELSTSKFILQITPKRYKDFMIKCNENKKGLKTIIRFYQKQYSKLKLEENSNEY